MATVAVIIAAIIAGGGPGGTPTPTPTPTATATPTPTATPDSSIANLWVALSPGTGCTRSSTQVSYNTSTDCTLAAACTAASNGDTVRLQTGDYGTFVGCTKGSPGVTFMPAAGATPKVRFNTTTTASWLTFDGIKIGGGKSDINGGTTHFTIKNAEVAHQMILDGRGVDFDDSHITLGPNLAFTMSEDTDGNPSADEGRVSIFRDDNGDTPSGILFTGDVWGSSTGGHTALPNGAPPSGCWDGILANAGGWDVENSTFANLTQGPVSNQGFCDAHVDSVSFYAGPNGTYSDVNFTNVYIYDSQSGIVDYDSHGVRIAIRNSAFYNIPPYGIAPCDAICVKGSTDEVIDHVTVKGSRIQIGDNNQGGHSAGATVRNSIIQGPVLTNGTVTGLVQDHNLCLTGTCTGTGSLNGSPAPTWVGGLTPTTFAGWALASSSRGENAASDGTDIGVNP